MKNNIYPMIDIYDDLGKRSDRAVWYITPSHGYLKVLISGVMCSGFKPSKYSYQQGNNYYLEEDCDAVGYLKALHGDLWTNKSFNEIPERFVNLDIKDLLEIIKKRSDQIDKSTRPEWFEHEGKAYFI